MHVTRKSEVALTKDFLDKETTIELIDRSDLLKADDAWIRDCKGKQFFPRTDIILLQAMGWFNCFIHCDKTFSINV